jgi:DNA-binding transcriptional LysR family regulator
MHGADPAQLVGAICMELLNDMAFFVEVDEARLAHEQLGELLAQPSGVLRASLPVEFATTYMAPLIAEFARRYPGIPFDFDLTPRRVDLVSEPFEVAIRMGELTDSNLIARLLARLPVVAYASPRYLEVSGEPEARDLAQHECLGFPKAGKWVLHRGDEVAEVEVGGRFLVNNSVGMLRRLATLDLGCDPSFRRDRRRRRGSRTLAPDIACLAGQTDTGLCAHRDTPAAGEDAALRRVLAGALDAANWRQFTLMKFRRTRIAA